MIFSGNNFLLEYLGWNWWCNTRGTKRKPNWSKLEKKAHHVLIKNSNIKICVNDTDKNYGPISADKNDVIKECCRQLYNIAI